MPASDAIVAVAGSASVDMTLRAPPPGWIGATARDCYTPETVQRLDAPLETHLGGNGGAAAYTIGRLGTRVLLAAPIGIDPLGRLVRGGLEDAGVEIIGPPGASTNVGMNAVDGDGGRVGTLQHPGPRVPWALPASDTRAGWLLVALFANVPRDDAGAVLDGMRQFRQDGRLTAFDPGIAWMSSMEPAEMHSIWREVDLLVATQDELGHWTGLDDPDAIIDRVRDIGPGRVVVKLGAAGASFTDDDGRVRHEPAVALPRSGLSIGAGDAFNGALLAGLASGKRMAEAVRSAHEVAARVVASGRGVLGVDDANEMD